MGAQCVSNPSRRLSGWRTEARWMHRRDVHGPPVSICASSSHTSTSTGPHHADEFRRQRVHPLQPSRSSTWTTNALAICGCPASFLRLYATPGAIPAREGLSAVGGLPGAAGAGGGRATETSVSAAAAPRLHDNEEAAVAAATAGDDAESVARRRYVQADSSTPSGWQIATDISPWDVVLRTCSRDRAHSDINLYERIPKQQHPALGAQQQGTRV